jgi:hypothetical protein
MTTAFPAAVPAEIKASRFIRNAVYPVDTPWRVIKPVPGVEITGFFGIIRFVFHIRRIMEKSNVSISKYRRQKNSI